MSLAVGLILSVVALPSMDGEEAMARAERLLRGLGVKGPMEIQSLLLMQRRQDQPQCWWISFATPDGAATVQLHPTSGRPFIIEGPSRLRGTTPSNQRPTVEGTARLWRVLRQLGYDKNVRLGYHSGFTHGPTTANFAVLVHGLPFFTLNPTYAHWVALNPSSHSIQSFRASPEPPGVNAWIPKVPAGTALARLKSWGHKRAVAKGIPKVVDPSEGDLRPELGYWQFKGESKARLVWRACKYTKIDGLPYSLGALSMFVDALDGTLREPDDNAWGMNP